MFCLSRGLIFMSSISGVVPSYFSTATKQPITFVEQIDILKQRGFFGGALPLPWENFATAVVELCYRCGTALLPLWHCIATAVALHCYRSERTLLPEWQCSATVVAEELNLLHLSQACFL